MKHSFFLLSLFISFTVVAQLPTPGQGGYKKVNTSDHPDNPSDIPPIMITNNRNTFMAYSGGKQPKFNSEDSLGFLHDIFNGNKYSYNKKYFYSTYTENKLFYYSIFIYKQHILLRLQGTYNDAEFEKCKHMLDKQADIYIQEKIKVIDGSK